MENGPIPYRVTKSLATDPGTIGCSRDVDMPWGDRSGKQDSGKSGYHLARTAKTGSEIDSLLQTGHRPGRFALSRFRNT